VQSLPSIARITWFLLALAILPIWIFTYLPMTDLPEYMLLAKILVSYNDPGFDYGQNFVMRIPWNPYSTYFWFAGVAGRLVGISIATKLYITASFVLTIVAFRKWIVAVAPQKEANVVLAIPLLFGAFFYIGVINFLFSIPFVFFAVASGWRICSQKASRLDVASLTLSLLAIWFSHPISFALALMLLGLQALLLFRGQGAITLAMASIGPLIAVAVYALTSLSNDLRSFDWSYDPLRSRIAVLLMPFGVSQSVPGNALRLEPVVPIFWLFIVACLVAAPFFKQVTPRLSVSWPIALPAMLLTAGTLFLPSTISGGLAVAMRAALPAAYTLVAAAPVWWYQSKVLRYLTISACAAALLMISYRIGEFQPEMESFSQAVSVIPPHQRVQPVITDLNTRHLTGYPLLHVTAWYHQWKGGTGPYLFSGLPHMPVKDRSNPMPGVPGEWNMSKFRYEKNQKGPDYFVVRTWDEEVLKDLESNVPLAAEVGDWKVFGPNGN